jgi:hypothetical protein
LRRREGQHGFLAPGLLPFFLHAHRVPEISRGILCAPTHYLFPLAGDRPGLKVVNASTRQPA